MRGQQCSQQLRARLTFRVCLHQTVHRHLRSSNVLFTQALSSTSPPSSSTVALADAGLAALLDAHHISKKGSDHGNAWAAPEVLLGEGCTVQTDIYRWAFLSGDLLLSQLHQACMAAASMRQQQSALLQFQWHVHEQQSRRSPAGLCLAHMTV